MHGVTAARPSLDDVYLRFTGRRFTDADQPAHDASLTGGSR